MALQLADVDHAYGKHQSLRRVSLNVSPGDRYGFLGHNGAGKTTAMRIALGLARPVRGRVFVDGFDALAFPREARARMGGMIEITGFYPGATGRRNLVELARLQGFKVQDARKEAERLLDVVGLAGSADRDVGGYSQGMRQRLGLAQALIGSPRYVLLDEPTNGLDPEGIAELRALLEQLSGEGITLLISSHQLHEIAQLCNRIGVLREGRMLLEAETTALLRSTRERYEVTVDDVERADATFGRLGLVHRPCGDRSRFVEIAGTPAADVVRELVHAGVGVARFAPRPTTLEEVYLRLGEHGGAAEFGEAAGESASSALPVPVGRPAPERRLAPRRGLWRMARFEFDRGLRPSVVALACVPAGIAIWRIGELATKLSAERALVQAGKKFDFSQVTAFEAVGRGLTAGLPVVVVLTAALASQSIAGDYSLGTLRNVMLRPLHRREIAGGKAVAVNVGAVALYLLLAVATLVAASSSFDFGDLFDIGQDDAPQSVLMPATEVAPYLPGALLAPVLPLLAYAGIGFLAGAIVRRSMWALALAIGAVLSLDVGRTIARPLGFEAWLPSAYVPSPLGDTSYLGFFTDLSRGSADAFFEYRAMAEIVPAAWILLTFGLATVVLLRRRIP